MVVRNDLTADFSLTGIEDAAVGTLIGPYGAFRLSDTWTLDARYVVGTADHAITTSGVFTGEYESQNSFAAVRVSGNFDGGAWRLHPSIEYSTSTQDSDAYIDGLRGPIAADSTTESFATGALLGYYNGLGIGNGNIVPYVGIEISKPTDSSSDMFGVFRGGLAWKLNNGGVLNFDFAHGAIGLSDIEDQMISMRLEIPL
jgi:hypothetical protein